MNVIRKLLEGFTKSATDSFNEVCTSQLALCCGSISQKLFKDTSLHTQLVNVLNDLESVYLDLVGSKLWAGVNATSQASSFKAAFANGDDANAVVLAAVKHMPADLKECALVAVKTLPWEEWVKLYATCHRCMDNGHFCPNCLKYLATIQSREINPKHPCNFHNMCKKLPVCQLPGKIGNCKQPPRNLNNPKAKAFLSAFQALIQALLANKEASNGNNDEEDKDSPRLVDCNVNDDGNNLHGFLSMVGSLKDWAVSSLVLTSAFSFVKSASLSSFSSLFLGASWALLNQFNLEFLS